jgi:hypothetical protein
MSVPAETTTHQDHVIAHVIGSTILGHFVFDESLYLVLDIGFIWRIYLDGEMGLLPGTVAIHELQADEELKLHLKKDAELLIAGGIQANQLEEITPARVECRIEEITFFRDDDKRRFVIRGEENELVLESSLRTRDFKVGSEDYE